MTKRLFAVEEAAGMEIDNQLSLHHHHRNDGYRCTAPADLATIYSKLLINLRFGIGQLLLK